MVFNDSDETCLADIVMVFLLPGEDPASALKVLVQWHRTVLKDAVSIAGCDVTVVTEEYSIVPPSAITRAAFMVPQLVPKVTDLGLGPIGSLLVSVFTRWQLPVAVPGKPAPDPVKFITDLQRPVCYVLRELLHVG